MPFTKFLKHTNTIRFTIQNQRVYRFSKFDETGKFSNIRWVKKMGAGTLPWGTPITIFLMSDLCNLPSNLHRHYLFTRCKIAFHQL